MLQTIPLVRRRGLPQFRVLAYPPSGQGPATRDAMAVHDNIRGLMRPYRADGSGSNYELVGGEGSDIEVDGVTVSSFNGTTLYSADWRGQPAFSRISSSIEYIEFGAKTATGAAAVQANSTALANDLSALGFFYLRPTAFAVNCKMPDAPGDPQGNPKLKTLRFRQTKPSTLLPDEILDGFSGISPDLPDGRAFETVQGFSDESTGVQVVAHLPGRAGEVESEPLAAKQQFEATLYWVGRMNGHPSGQAGIRLIWGEVWSIAIREGAKGGVVFSLEQFARGKWNVRARFDEATIGEFANTSRITVERIAGRFVITIDEHKFDFLFSVESKTKPGTGDVREATWKSAPLKLSVFGVRARLTLKLLRVVGRDDKPSRGSFERTVKRKLPPNNYVFVGHAVGWGGKHLERKVVGEVTTEGIHYTCSLRADPLGLESPAVSIVAGRCKGTHETPESEPLNITAAFLSGSMDEVSPEAGQNGVQMTMKVSRNLLADIALKEALDWQDYVRQFASITFEVRYALHPPDAEDGTPAPLEFTPWLGRFFYVMDESLSTSVPNSWDGSLTLQDPTMRLTKPHSTIDHRFIRDLGWLLALKSEQLGGTLHGGDCVQYLLSVEMGELEASRLNGNGDSRRFFTAEHYPLITGDADRLGYVFSTRPPTQSAEMLPVQWNNGVLDEIRKIAKMDFAMFFYEHIEGEDEGGQFQGLPVPIYADWRQWVANSPTWEAFDSDAYEAFIEGDFDLLIRAIELSRRGGFAYNRDLVWANPPEGAQNLPFPAVFMAEGRLPSDDPNSVENTGWFRTFVKEEPRFGLFPEAAAVYAAFYLARLRGVPIEWPKVTLRGDMRLKWGHKFIPHLSGDGTGARFSDATLKLDGRTFRILKTAHNFVKEKMGPDSFATTLSLFPILTGEV